MPRTRRPSHSASIAAQDIVQPFVIDPLAAYRPDHIRVGLGLAKHTLGTEIRRGRMRVSRRAGKYYILGEWLLEWLRGGEVCRRRKGPPVVPGGNGQAGEAHEMTVGT
jgi:hypothetical protein